jgi:hypothetical protein
VHTSQAPALALALERMSHNWMPHPAGLLRALEL